MGGSPVVWCSPCWPHYPAVPPYGPLSRHRSSPLSQSWPLPLISPRTRKDFTPVTMSPGRRAACPPVCGTAVAADSASTAACLPHDLGALRTTAVDGFLFQGGEGGTRGGGEPRFALLEDRKASFLTGSGVDWGLMGAGAGVRSQLF